MNETELIGGELGYFAPKRSKTREIAADLAGIVAIVILAVALLALIVS